MTCRTLLLAHARMAQPLAWSGGSLCVAYARASMPRVSRGPRRPSRHAWHRLVRPNLAAPAAASLLVGGWTGQYGDIQHLKMRPWDEPWCFSTCLWIILVQWNAIRRSECLNSQHTCDVVIFTASLRHESFSHNRVAIRRSLTDVGIRM